jgi:outer membrane protein assembly factor BamB
MMRDAGWLVLAGDNLYAAVTNRCLKIDPRDGKVLGTFHPPDENTDWGYLGVDADRLIGSQQIRGASYLAANTPRGDAGNLLGRGDHRRIITSKTLFCRNQDTGVLLWTYAPESARIANVSICAGDGGVYFLESSNTNVVSDTVGRALLKDFTQGASESLVKLDAASGRTLWKQQLQLPAHHAIYLCYANDIVLACSCDTDSKDYWYHLRACHADDGSIAWEKDLPTHFGTSDWAHGKQDKHPMIVGDVVYLKQGSFELATGKPRGFSFRTTNCAECSASAKHLFGRMNNVASTWSLRGDGSSQPLSPVVRPGCYTTIIPGGGIVMMPPHSAGCTCSQTIQTTIVWLPEGESTAADTNHSVSP